MNNKLVIIGLDGATFDIIKPLAGKGKLPFLQRIMQEGVSGILRSTQPPVTAPAWTSFTTGKNPGKHGLFDFKKINVSGGMELTYSTDCQSATLWDYLTEANLRVLLVNIPLTYPPRPVNGVCIAGFPVPRNSSYVYPEDKMAWVQSCGYITDWTILMQQNWWQSKFKVLKEVEKIRMAAFEKLLRNEPYDVAMMVISGTDHISHLEWQKGNRKGVEGFYIYIDQLLSQMEDKGLFQDADLAVMSDHGFTQGEYVFFANLWLMQEGYLSYNMLVNESIDKVDEERQKLVYGKKGNLSKILGKIGITRDNLVFMAKKTGLIRMERFLPHRLISLLPGRSPVPDWQKTKAYMVSNTSKGININLKGREQQGIVSEAEHKELCLEIVNKLRALRLPDGSEIFEYVDLKENVYHGPFVEKAPDIVLWPAKKCNVKMGKWGKSELVKVTTAFHASDGIFMFKGNDIRKQYECELNLEDLAPTFLHFLGLRCPDDLDGRVAKEIFTPKSDPAQRQIALRKPITDLRIQETAAVDEDSIAKQLKALGYL